MHDVTTSVQDPKALLQAHAQVARCLAALARVMDCLDSGQDPHPFAEVACEAASQASVLSSSALDLLIGRTSLQLQGQALRAPSWVYRAAWAVAARLAPGAICALHVPGDIAPDDVMALLDPTRRRNTSRIRAFALPAQFAALVEAQPGAPPVEERLAVVLVGTRRQLADPRSPLAVWSSIARSIVEWCEEQRRWTPRTLAYAGHGDEGARLAVDSAMLAGCMAMEMGGGRRVSFDAVLALLLVSAARACAQDGSAATGPGVSRLQRWVLSRDDAEEVPASCIGLLGALDDRMDQEHETAPGGALRLACVARTAWRAVHEMALDASHPEDAVRSWIERNRSALAPEMLRAITAVAGDTLVQAELDVARADEPSATTPSAAARGDGRTAAMALTDDEIGAFLDEFVAWDDVAGRRSE